MLQIESFAKQQIYIDASLRNGYVLRFQMNSTATTDGSKQKRKNDHWHNSESIAR